MPNGYHGSKGGWDVMEAPLLEIDPDLNKFADQYSMELEKNYRKALAV